MTVQEFENECLRLLSGKSNKELYKLLCNTFNSLSSMDKPLEEYPDEIKKLIITTYLINQEVLKILKTRWLNFSEKWFNENYLSFQRKCTRKHKEWYIEPNLLGDLVHRIFIGEIQYKNGVKLLPYLVDSETFEEALKKSEKDLQV